jgi:hypothetical protein
VQFQSADAEFHVDGGHVVEMETIPFYQSDVALRHDIDIF